MPRDLKLELNKLILAGEKQPLMTFQIDTVKEYLERALKAEELVTLLQDDLNKTIEKCAPEHEELQGYKETYDLQRHSIQQLSAQVVGLREGLEYALNQWEIYADAGLFDDESYLTDTDDLEGIKYREIKNLLTQPDPGAEIRERMTRLEKVAEEAKDVFKDCFADEEGFIRCDGYNCDCCNDCGAKKLIDALAALKEGDDS